MVVFVLGLCDGGDVVAAFASRNQQRQQRLSCRKLIVYEYGVHRCFSRAAFLIAATTNPVVLMPHPRNRTCHQRCRHCSHAQEGGNAQNVGKWSGGWLSWLRGQPHRRSREIQGDAESEIVHVPLRARRKHTHTHSFLLRCTRAHMHAFFPNTCAHAVNGALKSQHSCSS